MSLVEYLSDDLTSVFRRAIKARLREDGFTQVDRARAVGITEKHLSQMLTGKVDGSVRQWGKLLNAVGIDVRLRAS